MGTFRGTTDVRQPRPVVFTAFTNFRALPSYVPIAVRAEVVTPGAVGVGTKVDVVSKFVGREVATPHTITEFEQDRRIAYDVGAPSYLPKMHCAYDFETHAEGTRMHWAVDLDVPRLLVPPLMTRMIAGDYTKNLQSFAQLVEDGAI